MAYKTGWIKKIIDGVSTKVFAFAHVKSVYYNYSKGTTLKSKLDTMDSTISGKMNSSDPKYTGLLRSNGATEVSNTSDCLAIGTNAYTSGENNIAIGSDAVAGAPANTSYNANNGCIAIGTNSKSHQTITGANIVFSQAVSIGLNSRGGFGQVGIGHYSKRSNGNGSGTSGDLFVIGNGTSDNELSNALRVTGDGKTYAKGSYTASGADYAEFFEWADENTNNEDRVGFFVTLDGLKIKKAKSGDYILGIVSGNPCVVGNSDEEWKGRYITDNFNRYITESYKEPFTYFDEEKGEEVTIEMDCTKFKENPDYDPEKEYEQRENRPEWDYIGMIGVLPVYDDGSCQINGYCTVNDDGIATACERGENAYRVVDRVTDNIIKVIFK